MDIGRVWFPAVVLLGALAPAVSAQERAAAAPAVASGEIALAIDMAEAAGRFLSALTPEQRRRAVFAFTAGERSRWRYTPGPRPGVTFNELAPAQRHLAFGFLQTALSRRGVIKATGIMALEEVLRRRGSPLVRDPGAYSLAIYGEPRAGTTWGWRLEGHHLSIHATLVDGARLVVAPTFLGASPAKVDGELMNGAQVLAREEELGFRLLASLDGTQRELAVVRARAPGDILTGPGARLAPIPGLAAARMTAAQRRLLAQLVDEATGHLPPEIAARERERATRGGRLGELVFSWAGGARPGQPHYYRVAGPTFLYELDNTQEGASHVHSVWHARAEAGGDFGEDLLREHLASPAHAGLSREEQEMLAEIRGPWSRAVAPHRVVGNVYSVGAAGIAAYLIHTSEGLIVIDAGTREMEGVVPAGIVALGFRLDDVKLILVSHAHFDHVEALAALKKLTGGSVAAIAQEVPALSSGKDLSALGALGWEPVAVDRVLRDGEAVTLGDTTLRVVWTPGHTQGATSYTTTVVEDGRRQEVLFLASPAANAGVKLLGNPRHPTIADDLARTFAALRRLSPDVVLTFHPEGRELLDGAAFRRLVDEAEADTQRRLAAERAAR